MVAYIVVRLEAHQEALFQILILWLYRHFLLLMDEEGYNVPEIFPNITELILWVGVREVQVA
jgi:hypothetical protein